MPKPPRTFMSARRHRAHRNQLRIRAIPFAEDEEDEEDAMTVMSPLRPDDQFGDRSDNEVARLLSELLPATRLIQQHAVSRPVAFRALWSAYLAQAKADNDLPLASLATVLLSAVQGLPPGRLVEARLDANGASWAAWIDLESQTLLGVRRPFDTDLFTG